MYKKIFTTIVLIIVLVSCVACASKLPREKHKVTTGQSANLINLGLVSFTDLQTGAPVNLAEYMKNNNLDYILLIFGSVGCSSCNNKAQDLSKNYLNKHELFLQKPQYKFEVVGINTDIGGAKQRFDRIMSDPKLKQTYGYEFIKWHDPSGQGLKQYFMDADEAFGVPYVVMLSKTKLLWKITPKEHYTVQMILDRALATIKGNVYTPVPTPVVTPQQPVYPQAVPVLSLDVPWRFNEIIVKHCQTQVTQKLSDIFQAFDLMFIQVSKSSCDNDPVCISNTAKFSVLKDSCQKMTGMACEFINLSQNGVSQEFCEKHPNIYVGGKEFFDVFATHFNWAYEPIYDAWGAPYKIAEVKGPILLGFKKNGELIYSFTDKVLPSNDEPDSIIQVFKNINTKHIKFADFRFYGDIPNSSVGNITFFDFKDLLQNSKFSVIFTFDRYCGSCIEELSHWSDPNNKESPLWFCKDNPKFCQLIALESALAQPNTDQGQKDFYQEIKNDFFIPNNIAVPLAIDTLSKGQGVDEYSRVYESYLSPLFFDEWQGVYGIVIYDNENKIIANFKSSGPQNPDPVNIVLKELKKVYDSIKY